MIKLCIFVLVLGLAAPFFIKGPNGQPIFSLQDFKPDLAEEGRKAKALMEEAKQQVNAGGAKLKASLGQDEDSNAPAVSRTLYKWQDENGTWHYSQTPPAGQVSETLTVSTNTNIIQAQALPEPEPVEQTAQQKNKAIDLPSLPSPMTISPNKTQQLIEDARNVQQLMNQRGQQLDAI